MVIKRLVLYAALLALLMVPALVNAQENIAFQVLNVSLWPEYDRPQMLVIYNIVLSPEVPLPVEVEIRIPAAAGEPNAVAEQDMNGRLYNVAYTREVRGDWASVKFIATEPVSQLEYYDPGLTVDGSARHFDYTWPGDHAVGQLNVQVQQPAGARDLVVSPPLGGGTQKEDGLVYYAGEFGAFGVGEMFTLSLDYQKDSTALSLEMIEILQVQPSEPIGPDTAGRVDILDAMPWFGGVGLILIVVSVIWFWRGGRKADRSASAQKRRRRRASIPELQKPEAGDSVYCHQCGKRAEPGDRFCRACGTRLRTE